MPAQLDPVVNGGSTAASGAVSGMSTYVPALIAGAVIAVFVVVALIVIVRRRATRRHTRNSQVDTASTMHDSPAAVGAAGATPAAERPNKEDPVVITTPHSGLGLATMSMPLTTAIPVTPTPATGAVSTGKKSVLDYIDERTIVLDVDETDRDSMIRTLAGMMSLTGRIADVALVAQAAFRRETHGTTGMGNGIAIAHAKSAAVLSPVLAFARSKQGIEWNAPDGLKATLIFMVAVPKSSAGTDHLRVLSQLSRCLTKPTFRAALEAAQTPAAVLEALAISANIKKAEPSTV